jgi:PhnB protein
MTQSNRMQGVLPYLAMAGRSAEAIDFHSRAFGSEDIGQMPLPDGQRGLMQINGGALMKTDHGMNPGTTERRTIQTDFGHLQLVVDEGRTWWDRAVAASCTVLEPYERQPWGDDWGLEQDPFGLKWAILQDGDVGS